MKARLLLVSVFLTLSWMCFAKADGAWLKKVPAADHARVNPYAADSTAIAAGANIFRNNCAKCHGQNAEGKSSRPSLKSDRIQQATDGDLAWLLKNGEPYKGMPIWGGLPEQQRWQLVAYLRNLNTFGVQK
jgi:mono/diheme cytochrome c family protein